MSSTLRRDMYSLQHPGFLINQVKSPDPDPLVAARYSCIYWVDHLLDSGSGSCMRQSDNAYCRLEDSLSSIIYTFLSTKYLYWLEALSLLQSMSEGVLAVEKLERLLVSLLAILS